MMRVDYDLVPGQTDLVNTYYSKRGSGGVLLYDDFIKTVSDRYWNKLKPEYPVTIKVAPPVSELLDFKPKDDNAPPERRVFPKCREITIQEPIVDKNGTHYWFMSSLKDVKLGLGYVDGNKTTESFASLSDKDIHMLLAGKTGMGKSVAVNDIILTICTLYAPWEVELILSDAKIVEFKKYAEGALLPHVSTIAATGDTDFLISVITTKYKDMLDLNGAFSNTDYAKLEDYREAYGVAIPARLVIMDEFQVMFSNAAEAGNNVLTELTNTVDNFARLGRNTRYHLILCSQQIGGSIPEKTLEQITVRAALGLSEETSKKIINNAAAKTITTKGKMIFNKNTGVDNPEMYNTFYKVPYAPPDQMAYAREFLEGLGKKFDYAYKLVCYDEKAIVEERFYQDSIMKFKPSKDIIYLGEPSYLTDNGVDRIVPMEFNNVSKENILIWNQDDTEIARYSKMLLYNFTRPDCKVNVLLINGNPLLSAKCGLTEYQGRPGLLPKQVVIDIDSIAAQEDNAYFLSFMSFVGRRKLMMDVDKYIFDTDSTMNPKDFEERLLKDLTTNEVRPTIDSDGFARARFNTFAKYTTLNLKRICMLRTLLAKPKYQSVLGLITKASEPPVKLTDSQIIGYITPCIQDFCRWGAAERRLYLDDIEPMYIWISGIDSIQGFDNATTKVEDTFKTILNNTPNTKVRFIITSVLKSPIDAYIEQMEFFFLDNTTGKLETNSKVGAPDRHGDIANNLGYLFTKTKLTLGRKAHKFKKMAFDGERFS